MLEVNLLKLQRMSMRMEELEQALSQPEIVSDLPRFTALSKELGDIEPIVSQFQKYQKIEAEIKQNHELLNETEDAELVEMLKSEQHDLETELAKVDEELQVALLPKDPRDELSLFMEIRSGAGGEEAALFAYELYRMYQLYTSEHGFKCKTIELNETEIGGIKEIVFQVEGKGAWSRLKYEMGVHRVQRVPATESGGRIHTSTATVAVIPEATQTSKVEINPKDIRIDTYRASGAGGQHVNMTDSAVRITHFPTGLVVTCQDERSQIKNREKAMLVLISRLEQLYNEQHQAELSEERRSQIGTGDRSERIRTYNYPQGRVTDHRIGLTLYQLQQILDGDLDLIIEQLQAAERNNIAKQAN
ncbi:peptide chain release factor 1 [Amygdalobacter nucleatus]|uniref:peptide chain release factor 1 n=1 Tax=Amygdalobacter nucleatus TaxID=3029274 RepID=UPI0027A61361|nr:peptide chain release factor 1 [Amygdalobacter nucleatus]WEG37334.1 peptide chain release factor 1 [Amygdalobacter nucleatus]